MKNKEKESEFPGCLHVLLKGYSPVSLKDAATHYFSTSELAESIEQHTGEFISAYLIVQEMKQLGYIYGVNGELNLFWYLKKNE